MGFVSLKQTQVFEGILDAILHKYGISRTLLVESSVRSYNVMRPRQLAYYCLREYAGMTYPAIAELFKRNHTTILHGCRVIENLGLQEDAKELWKLSTSSSLSPKDG